MVNSTMLHQLQRVAGLFYAIRQKVHAQGETKMQAFIICIRIILRLSWLSHYE